MADPRDEVTERLVLLAEELARKLGGYATVLMEPAGPNEVVTTITPTSDRALGVQWTEFGGALDLTGITVPGELPDRDLDRWTSSSRSPDR